jgi:hypothetical protein
VKVHNKIDLLPFRKSLAKAPSEEVISISAYIYIL